MSERPGTANAVMSRLRRPAGRLRDMPIWSKLGLIMLVPTLATIVVGTNGLVGHIDQASDAERARTMAVLSRASGELVDHLQNERAYGVVLASVKDDQRRAKALELYNGEHKLVDDARLPYSQQRAALTEVPTKLAGLLSRVDGDLLDLPALRSQVANGTLKLTDIATSYGDLLSGLLDIRDAAAQLAGDIELSDHMRVAAAVARAKEALSQQRIVGHEVLGQDQLSAKLRKDFITTQTGQDQAELTLRAVATDAERQLYETTVAGVDLRTSEGYAGYFEAKVGEAIADVPFSPEQWDAAMVAHAKLMRNVEQQFDTGIVEEANALHADVQRRVLIETGALLGMLLLAILFAWLVARSMARSLRELRQGALSIAQYGLPHAVNRLRDPALSTQLTPAQLADQIAEPLPVRSNDEFGQVTEAFNAVHLEAVRTAAEQAALRASVSTMFVNLARRSQILVDRLIGHLDRLERGEEDPDRLAELFQLDHLATRMRRNDENLLVLAGADSTRVQREPAALMDVLRAAQSEVEHYTRIEFGAIDRDIEVAAHAVNDLVHLVAELFDNATAFSPPDSQVMVEARRVGDRATLYVEDRGIGISGEQLRDLNERLANPPMVDVAVSRMMGLVVVARLANRHGVEVELRPAPGRGTVADVSLPPTVLVPRAVSALGHAGAPPGIAGGYPAQPPYETPQPAARPGLPAPLALESGPAAGPFGAPSGQPHSGGRPFDPTPPLVGGGMLGASAQRNVPAWSDLTGVSHVNGGASNGANGFHGPAARPDESLPRRLPADPYAEGGPTTGGPGPIPRQMSVNPESHPRIPFVPPVSAPPVSAPPVPPGSMRPTSGGPTAPPISAPPVSGPPISAPPVSGPPGLSPPVSGSPISGPPVSGQPAGANAALTGPSGAHPIVPSVVPPAAASAPPAWPPVRPPDREVPTAPVAPNRAALDMTAEIPRIRPAAGAAAGGPGAVLGNGEPPTGAAGPGAHPTGPQSGNGSQAAGPDQPADHSLRQTAGGENVAGPGGAAAPDGAAGPGHPAAEQAATAAHAAAAAQTAATQQLAAAQAAGIQQTAAAQSVAGRQAAAAHAAAAEQAAAAQRAAAETRARLADETMELPIFRELESAWFSTRRSAAQDGVQAAAPPAVSAQRFSTAEPARVPGPPQQARSPEAGRGPINERTDDAAAAGTPAPARAGQRPADSWRTAADEGWQAARAVAESQVTTITNAGLPKRTPMAQLVPGGVDRGGNSVQRRTPEAVRGLLSAYHRGVQRGRSKEHPTTPDDRPGGPQSSQAGKEHEG